MSDPTVKVPQPLAIYESGTGRSDLVFQAHQNEDGLDAVASDDLYDYEARPHNQTPISGTIFIRNKTTGEVRAVPVGQMLQIRKRCRQGFQRVEGAQAADLISNFGSRKAQRIYSQRQGAAK